MKVKYVDEILEFDQSMTAKELLQRLNIWDKGCVVVKNATILDDDEAIDKNDEVEIMVLPFGG
ncbi:MAG: MoaD/ThiS family protein [Thermotogae bacterium]|nr:MoaD/ThiS family protein [Thermotogota bacterium]